MSTPSNPGSPEGQQDALAALRLADEWFAAFPHHERDTVSGFTQASASHVHEAVLAALRSPEGAPAGPSDRCGECGRYAWSIRHSAQAVAANLDGAHRFRTPTPTDAPHTGLEAALLVVLDAPVSGMVPLDELETIRMAKDRVRRWMADLRATDAPGDE